MTDSILRATYHRSVTTIVPYPAATVLLLDAYTGAAAAYSFRKLRAAYAGSAVRIRRSSDNAEADIGFQSDGDFDTAAASAHIGGGSGFIVTWYDQSGNAADATQATSAEQPAYNATGFNSLPGASFVNASNHRLFTGVSAVTIGAQTDATVAAAVTITTEVVSSGILNYQGTGDANTFGVPGSGRFFRSASSSLHLYRNGSPHGALAWSTSDPMTVIGVNDGANFTPYKDGAAGTSGSDTDTWTATGQIGIMNDTHTGVLAELILWPTDQTANVTGIDTDMSTYYGV